MNTTVTYDLLRKGIDAKRESHIDWTDVTDDLRWWIGGQMDGDGCIRICPQNGIMVRIAKAEKGWPCLVWLKNMLKGKIYKGTAENEFHQAMKEWCIRGQAALDFCKVIQNHTFLKKPQLEKALEFLLYGGHIAQMQPLQGSHVSGDEIFSGAKEASKKIGVCLKTVYNSMEKDYAIKGWNFMKIPNPVTSEIVKRNREDLVVALQDMKKVEHEPIKQILPKPYIAGFVDAEGCLRAIGKNSTTIAVAQKYRAVCDAICKQYSGNVSYVEKDHPAFVWSIHAGAKDFLRDIAPFLIEKRGQAELLLNMKAGEGRAVKAALRLMKGNQVPRSSRQKA